MFKIISRNGIFETIDKQYANNYIVNAILYHLNDNTIIKAYNDNIPFCTIEISKSDDRITIYDKNEKSQIYIMIPKNQNPFFVNRLNEIIDIFQFL